MNLNEILNVHICTCEMDKVVPAIEKKKRKQLSEMKHIKAAFFLILSIQNAKKIKQQQQMQ
jgi:hypothetical protein